MMAATDILLIEVCWHLLHVNSHYNLSIYSIYRGSPLFWIGVGVGLSALFSMVRTENCSHNCTLHVLMTDLFLLHV